MYSVFDSGADVWTIDTWDDSILGFIRTNETGKLIVLLNFSEYDKTAWIDEDDGEYAV